ncbi:MAG: bifunctional phosphoribosyl-AMP cyclohydrolase/phosphoribosyl-ATP diphosphatase HisIE [Lachnospirales bacterium]
MENIKFDEKGLIPVVAQDYISKEVLMVAYMNEESLNITMDTGFMCYFSRSRNKLWKKGETSGNVQKVINLKYDCDGDTILALVDQEGVACHTGETSCFFNSLYGEESYDFNILGEIYKTIETRAKMPKEGSYTNYLLDKGIDKILKKVGEETAEVIIGAKNADKSEIQYEVADLMYHLSVMLYERGLNWNDVFMELIDRR